MNDIDYNYIPLPYDGQGFFYRIGEDDLEITIAESKSNEIPYHFMRFLCIAINTIDLMRKNDLDVDNALDLAHHYYHCMPWKNEIILSPAPLDRLMLDHYEDRFIDLHFITSIAALELKERDSMIEEYKKHLYAISDAFTTRDTILFEYYFAYLDYAFDELLSHWSTATYRFIAPQFATKPLDLEVFGALSDCIICTSYVPSEIGTTCYDMENDQLVTGCYNEGAFEPYPFFNNSDYGDDEDFFPNPDTNHIQGLVKTSFADEDSGVEDASDVDDDFEIDLSDFDEYFDEGYFDEDDCDEELDPDEDILAIYPKNIDDDMDLIF
ncbi:hypothetical protein [Chakrabartyella piscis]|uniref:hypothetical protein n=1 Tax=Chakrabartyella piscis TaxID=2918914 RepID=UPI00295862D6|nr:hypothetical protein [Chakrabartyella piscis]